MNLMRKSSARPGAGKRRLRLAVRGAVQGVGFRPFVFRLANDLGMAGWVNNSPQGVSIEVEGRRDRLEHFRRRLESEKPALCFLAGMESSWLAAAGYAEFEIRASAQAGVKSALVLPDLATCPDCRREIFDVANRRFHYPFTNCTHCGPRFSLIEALPYDRANTSMRGFKMCPACQAEYDNPRDRRFHAQPNACPVCGPRLELWTGAGAAVFGGHDAMRAAAQAIRRGQIVAVKGLGGFHLMVDARNESAVRRLRERKQREEKPLALMVPSLADTRAICQLSPLEEELLVSPAAPIVLLEKIGNRKSEIANPVAPGNPNLGVMLPSNPLHHLLMAELDFPVVATSGNLSDEPICTNEHEALARLRGMADWLLVHNRPIVRPEDDSIVRVMLDREMILRRARGYAPLPVQLPSKGQRPKAKAILAMGAQLKNSVALAAGENVFISQHLGDLETEPAQSAFRRTCKDLPGLYSVEPEIIAADLHPDYLSTRHAQQSGKNIFGVQHHVAHVLSCIAENDLRLPALGLAWDGTGYGTDGSVWGGEFFLVTESGVERVAHLRPFRLPGGDKAVKQPRRVALAMLYELYGEAAFEMEHLPPIRVMLPVERITFKGMLQRRINSPSTSSVGRLFDAVASLINLRQNLAYEGQAAMELEFALNGFRDEKAYALPLIRHAGMLMLDWQEMIHQILVDGNAGVAAAEISAKFHNALAEAAVAVAKKIGQPRVALSGGCFQNRYLTERLVTRLRAEKFEPFWHRQVPPNDGGIALGQIFAARNHLTLK